MINDLGLIDAILPKYDFGEVHAIHVHRSPASVLGAVKRVTPAETPWFRLLIGLRALPARLLGGSAWQFSLDRPVLEQFLDAGFSLLAEEADRELVVGRVGQFWRMGGSPTPRIVGPEEFRAFDRRGYAKVALNFRAEPAEGGEGTRLSTDTRIAVPDWRARMKFGAYWCFILPGSAVIRREWLAAIKRRAETA